MTAPSFRVLAAGLIAGLVAVTLAVSAAPATARTAEQAPQRARWVLKFQDNFGDPATSGAKWGNTAPSPLPADQCFAYGRSDGRTVVRVRSQRAWDPGVPSCRMQAGRSFGGGGTFRFSARVKFHGEPGTLSSFWVTGFDADQRPNEMDVFENNGKRYAARKPRAGACVRASDTGMSRDDESDNRLWGLQQNVYYRFEPRTGHRNCVRRARAHSLYDGRFHTVAAIWNPGSGTDFFIDGRREAHFPARWARRTTPVFPLLTNKSSSPAGKPSLVVDWVKVHRLR